MTKANELIAPHELMIGNWVMYLSSDKSEFYVRVNAVFDDGSVVAGNGIKMNFDPIALTPEILEKAGFEWDHITSDVLSGMRKGLVLIFDQCEYGWTYQHGSTQLNYVHQLQNLYFALTGTELKIDL